MVKEASVTLLTNIEECTWETEASILNFAPGDWPDVLLVEGIEFYRCQGAYAFGDLVYVPYTAEYGGLIMVYND